MNLSPALEKAYTEEHLSAREAQRAAEFIAFGPIVFQVSRLMLKHGILEHLRDADDGLTIAEVAAQTGLSKYAAQVLLEASLSIGTVLVDPATERFSLSKTGWFLLNDPATRVNVDFNHDVNYLGFFDLDAALESGTPAGLKRLGNWPTIYEGLSQLSPAAQKSWFAFDHFYSDSSFDEALQIVFASPRPKRLLDVGGNTGRWALRCVECDADIEVCIADLPQQIEMMRANVAGHAGCERISGYGVDLLAADSALPADRAFDAIWMSQFLDCFSEEQVSAILAKAAAIMQPQTTLYIMETLWDRQRFEPAAFCLTQTSLYFTAMANGNSKMFHSDDLLRLINASGLNVRCIHDNLGQGHSIIEVCK